ncbi:MAG: phosphatidylglycerol lysyltransferase domain-containing protein [Candidatus Saccharimonadales bacterium]
MFKTFPEFSKLTLADREEYEGFIKQYPPVGDISFVSMMTWWEGMGSADVSTLNGNLVISYWVPGDEEQTGLCLVGTNDIEHSICTIFDYLRSKGERARLTNVPEFVVHSLRYPELFSFTSLHHEDEYVIPLSRLADIDEIPGFRRARIKRFMKAHTTEQIEIRKLDLTNEDNQGLFIDAAERWPKVGFNDLGSVEAKVLVHTIQHASEIGIENVSCFVGNELQAYCLYHPPHDNQYIIADNARFNYAVPGIFDYASFAFAKYFRHSGVVYANIHADMGFAKLRVFKLALRPSNFFRKYIVEPVKDRKHADRIR